VRRVTAESFHQRPLKRQVVCDGSRSIAGPAFGHNASIAAAIAVASSVVGLGETLCCIAYLQRHVAVLAAWQLFAL
jgi:hypothetical protein